MRALRFAVLLALLLGGAGADVAPMGVVSARAKPPQPGGFAVHVHDPVHGPGRMSGRSLALLLLFGVAATVAARWLGAIAGQGRFLASR